MRSLVRRQTVIRLIILVLVYLVIFNIHTTLLGTNRSSDCPSLPGPHYPWRQAVITGGMNELRYIQKQDELRNKLSPAKDLHQDPRFIFHMHQKGEEAAKVVGVRGNGKLDNRLFDVQGKFLFNESRYPPGKLPIFPDEVYDKNDDRIWNQMRYVPGQVLSNPSKRKKILLFNGLGGESPGDTRFLQDKCPVRACDLTGDRGQFESADVVIWQHSVSLPFGRRPRHQVWGIYFLESPYHTPSLDPFSGDRMMNWTATYRHESTIVAPYYKFTPYAPAVREKAMRKAAQTNFAKGKTKMVAWFVSNCGAQNGRLQYAHALGEHIAVDIYGGCGKHSCPRSRTDSCFRMLSRDYKFYLAFENSNCRDYITEKFFLNSLSNNILPIVMGAHPDDYARAAPPNSFIHVDDFQSPKDLADFLHKVDANDALYNSYFAWKGSGLVDTNCFFWCRLCMMAHEADNHKSTGYSNADAWWRHNKCVPGPWAGTKRTWAP